MPAAGPLALDRRSLLLGAAALGALAPAAARAAVPALGVALGAGPARARLVGLPGVPETLVWAYNGRVPGPELRFRQGDTARIAFTNALPEETTIHWHGLRVPNAMDGVPNLPNPPIGPGERFDYAFSLRDAGTFWYHPHANGAQQLGRGLSGAFIVEEAEPPPVDRDVTWVLQDWRLTREARVADGFGSPMDSTHAGRIGNTVTINGRLTDEVPVRAGERLRLRLINAASARIVRLDFAGHRPWVIALDGQPLERPHRPDQTRVTLGPGQRADLILDLTGRPGERFDVVDGFYPRLAYRLTRLVYGPEPPLRDVADLPPPAPLPPNPLPEPDLANAVRREVVLDGGMHGRRAFSPMDGPQGPFWWINGTAMIGHAHHPEPFITVKRGQTVHLGMVNETQWWHPMHLHGFPFRLLSHSGEAVEGKPWRDTVLLGPKATAELAFVAEEPGHWMLHCHVLEHQETGMMALLRVE